MKDVFGIEVFNGTPHPVTFRHKGVDIIVPPDEVISARAEEEYVTPLSQFLGDFGVEFVRPTFLPTPEGQEIINRAHENGADLIVGSIIAAQAYPGQVFAMTPYPGYERVPPAEKRVSACKFTIY